MEQKDYTVWFCDAERIASFHSVADYERRSFTSHAFFMDFLRGLQERGYRFQ